jgi:hypothetical protein
MELDSFGSGLGPVASSCERDNEPYGVIKSGDIFCVHKTRWRVGLNTCCTRSFIFITTAKFKSWIPL